MWEISVVVKQLCFVRFYIVVRHRVLPRGKSINYKCMKRQCQVKYSDVREMFTKYYYGDESQT
jgi:hypothetical protein